MNRNVYERISEVQEKGIMRYKRDISPDEMSQIYKHVTENPKDHIDALLEAIMDSFAFGFSAGYAAASPGTSSVTNRTRKRRSRSDPAPLFS